MMQRRSKRIAKAANRRLKEKDAGRRMFLLWQDLDNPDRYTLELNGKRGQVMNRAAAEAWASRRPPNDIIVFVKYADEVGA